MTRFLSSLGASLIATLAIAASMATAAQADTWTVETLPFRITAGNATPDSSLMAVHGGEIKCATRKYTGSGSSSPTTTISLTPTYTGCTFAGLAASINVNGCSYLYHLNTSAGNTTATMDIVCPAGKEITVTAPSVGTAKCTVHIPAQTGLGGITFQNTGAGSTRELTASVTDFAMRYSQTMGFAETGNCATADSTTSGALTFHDSVTAETIDGSLHNGSTHIGIYMS